MKTRVVTLAGDAEAEARIATELSTRGDVTLILRCMDRVELLAAVRAGGLDAVISAGFPPWLDRQTVDEAHREGVRVVCVTGEPAHGERLQASGVAVVDNEISTDELIDACRESPGRVHDALPSSQPSRAMGRLVAVWGAKGAPGRTTIAMEVAAQVARADAKTLLVDADPYGGDMLQFAGIAEELPTVVWAARMAGKEELDAARLALDFRRLGHEGPILLPGLPRAELWAEISDFAWRELLVVARATFSFTICDVGFCVEPETNGHTRPGRNHMARTCIQAADHIVAVCRGDPIGIKNFLWGFHDLRELVDVDDILVVANRVIPGDEREVGLLLRRHLGKRPVAYVHEIPDVMKRTVERGSTVAELQPGSNASNGMRTLAAALGAHIQASGFLSRFVGRS